MGSWTHTRTNRHRAATLLAAVAALGAPPTHAQQVLEIDTAAGRVIIDDEWRAIRTIGDMPLDRTRAILYANDDEDPEAVMAFSLETGERIRTIPTPTGGGPRELERGMLGMTLGRDGRLYVSGYVRVLEFDPLGQYVSDWRPRALMVWDVCEVAGHPAVVASIDDPSSYGVIRRAPDGTDEDLGAGIADRRATTTGETLQGGAQTARVRTYGSPPRIACADDTAYVVTTSAEGPDSVFVYHRDGEVRNVPVPTEFTDRGDDCKVKVDWGAMGIVDLGCTDWTRDREPTLDGRGNLLLLGRDQEVPGAIIDPETGCYAVLRKPEPSRSYDALHIYQDSALVFRYASWEREDGSFSVSTAADRISLHPLRRVSGEPCPGMLPSVDDVG